MRICRGALAAAMLALSLVMAGGQAQAHGKELEVKLQSVIVDVSKPETRFYIVSVVYKGDREPTMDANVQLSATRANGGLGPVRLAPLGEPGLYGGQVTFPRFGDWTVTIGVADSLGNGEVSLSEQVFPAAPRVASRAGTSSSTPQSLGLFLRFDARDVANIVVRVAHSLAAVAWYGLTAAILGAFYVIPTAYRDALLRGVARLFPWVAGLSLALLAATGLYNAIYNAPIRPPGAFNVGAMERIPFGTAYLLSLGVKVIALAAGSGLALAMARALRLSTVPLPPGGAAIEVLRAAGLSAAARGREKAIASLRHLAFANAALGVATAVAVSVAIHLHLLSHLALVVPR